MLCNESISSIKIVTSDMYKQSQQPHGPIMGYLRPWFGGFEGTGGQPKLPSASGQHSRRGPQEKRSNKLVIQSSFNSSILMSNCEWRPYDFIERLNTPVENVDSTCLLSKH
jgi:hypothetical protein